MAELITDHTEWPEDDLEGLLRHCVNDHPFLNRDLSDDPRVTDWDRFWTLYLSHETEHRRYLREGVHGPHHKEPAVEG